MDWIADLRISGAALLFGPPPGQERAQPGTGGESPETAAQRGGVGVIFRADMHMMHQTMRRDVMPEQQAGVDHDAQSAQNAMRAVDQLVRVRVGHLPKEQAVADKKTCPFRSRQGILPTNPLIYELRVVIFFRRQGMIC